MKNRIKRLILFIALFGICNIDCFAETKLISTEQELKDISNGTDTSITEIKLTKDITFSKSLNFYLTDTPLVFDLNGYTIDMGDRQIQFHFGHNSNLVPDMSYNTGSLTLTDTSSSKQGKIITKEGILISPHFFEKTDIEKNYTLNIDGGTYISADDRENNGRRNIFSIFDIAGSTNNNKVTFNLNVKNGIFKSLSPYSAFVFSTSGRNETDMTMNFKIDSMYASGYGIQLSNNILGSEKIENIINADSSLYETVYDNNNLKKNKVSDNTLLASEINGGLTNNGFIKVENSSNLEIDDIAINTTYGYSNISKKLNIKNNSNTDLVIKKVITSDITLASVSGNDNVTIPAGETNDSYELTLANKLNSGSYNTLIVLEDSTGNLYYANVTITVAKKEVSNLGIGFNRSWAYGEDVPELNVYGLQELSAGDYKITYASKGTNVWSKDIPQNAGTYSVKVEITNDNYVMQTATSDFIIKPSEKVIKIVANSSTHEYDGNSYSDSTYKIYFDENLAEDGKLLYNDIISNVGINGSVKYVSDNTENNNVIDRESIPENIKNNYKNIEFVDGTIAITPITQEIVVTASDATKSYDGEELTNNSYTYTENVLINNDKLEATITGSRKYAGRSDNVVTSVKVMNGDKDVTDNYTFGTHKNGILKVNPIPLVFSLNRNIYVRVNKTLTIDKIKELLNSNINDYRISKLSGTAGTFNDVTGFTAGSTEGQVTMDAIAPGIDLNDDGEVEYLNAITTFTINVVKKEEAVLSGIEDNQVFEYTGNAHTPLGNLTSDKDDLDISSLSISYKGTGNTTYTSSEAPVNAGTYEITYRIPDNNDYYGNVTYSFTISKKVINKPEINKTTFVYNKSTLGYPDLVSSNMININGVTTSINVGNYSFVISLVDNDNYIWNDSSSTDYEVNWSIIKADPTYTIPDDLEGIAGQPLSSIPLPKGFTWENADQVLISGTKSYKAKYTPTDIDNYNVINDIDINVTAKNKYNLSYNVIAGDGGVILEKTEFIEGETTTIKFIPDNGYTINEVFLDGIKKDIVNNELSISITSNHLIEVSYKKLQFKITVKDNENATIVPNNVISVDYGDSKEFTITANIGYKITKILINNVDKTSALTGNKFTIDNITSDLEMEVISDKTTYSFLEGNNLNYMINKDKYAKFRIDADYTKFENDGKVYVDGELVDPANYTSESGSTIITLKKEYVDTLSEGVHTLRVLFADGEATTTFTVAKLTGEENPTPEENPNTEDNIIFYIITGIISTLGLVGTTTYFYKRKQTN